MSLAFAEPMAKRKDTTVKLDQEIAAIARMVASSKGISLAEYLTSIVEPVVRKELDAEYERRKDHAAKAAEPKRRR